MVPESRKIFSPSEMSSQANLAIILLVLTFRMDLEINESSDGCMNEESSTAYQLQQLFGGQAVQDPAGLSLRKRINPRQVAGPIHVRSDRKGSSLLRVFAGLWIA